MEEKIEDHRVLSIVTTDQVNKTKFQFVSRLASSPHRFSYWKHDDLSFSRMSPGWQQGGLSHDDNVALSIAKTATLKCPQFHRFPSVG
jgi:hypothetical protein